MTMGMVDPYPVVSIPDNRRISGKQPGESRLTNRARAPFTCNATGSITTAVGANAAPGTNDNNVARRGEKFQLFTSGGVIKEETVFRVTDVTVGASTTLTFTPAAAVAPVSGDVARWIEDGPFSSIEAMDRRLTAISATTFSPDRLKAMTIQDKIKTLIDSDIPALKHGV